MSDINEIAESELIVSNTMTPIIRAGLSNGFPIATFIYSILIYKALSDLSISTLLALLIIVFTVFILIKYYLSSIARILIFNTRLRIITPIGKKDISFKDIKKFNVNVFSSWMMLSLKIKMKRMILPKYFHFIAIRTNLGTLFDTKKTIEEILRKKIPKDTLLDDAK